LLFKKRLQLNLKIQKWLKKTEMALENLLRDGSFKMTQGRPADSMCESSFFGGVQMHNQEMKIINDGLASHL
jgi:hypothetical protein